MENQPQNPEYRINPENFHPCLANSERHFICFYTICYDKNDLQRKKNMYNFYSEIIT